MENVALIGIDLGKHSFHIHCQDRFGKALLRKKFNRTKLIESLATFPVCTIVMEACAGAHYMARRLAEFGHESKLISPQFVRPFVKSNKNDFITAQGAEVRLDPSPQNKVKSVVSNLALEGIYFFSGFNTFFAINRATGTMNGSVDGIKYIQRDELTHLEVFAGIYNTIRVERPELFTKKLIRECQAILKQACEHEKVWGRFVIDGGIPEINNEINDAFLEFRCEEVAKLVGLQGIYPGATNPIPWVDDYRAVTKGNFFESKPTSYTENKPKFSRRGGANAPAFVAIAAPVAAPSAA